MSQKTAVTKSMPTSAPVNEMFVTYRIRLDFKEKLAAGLPKDPAKLLTFLTVRAPAVRPENATLLEDMADDIEVFQGHEGGDAGITTTFCSKYGVPVWEARTLKSHVKDVASCLAKFWDMRNAKSVVANRIAFQPDYIAMYDEEGKQITQVTGKDIRPITITDRMGRRSAVKIVEYVLRPHFEFDLTVLNDGVVTEKMLHDIFRYGGMVKGLGQDRNVGMGRYTYDLKRQE